MSKARTGSRAYECADCQTRMMFMPWEMSHKCKPRCRGCGGTFFNPASDGAKEQSTNIGTARAIAEKMPPATGREHHQMQEPNR